MPEINPNRFFRFAAEHNALLTALYYRRDRISEAELLARIRNHAQPGAPAATHVLDQLLALGFMEQSPSATADFEMTRHFGNLLGVLLRQFRLTSVAVIQAYVDSLRQGSGELAESLATGKDAQAIRVLNETNDTIERLRQDSRNNRDAIIAEAVRTKANRDQLTVRDRFAGINRLWENYIIPLRDMIDVNKVLDASLDELGRVLQGGAGEWGHDQVLLRELGSAASRLRRMRRDVARDFHESLQEISPLYHEMLRDTRLVRGAVLALEQADRQGGKALGLAPALALPVWRMEGQLDDEELRAYLHGVRGYTPSLPPPLKTAVARGVDAFIEPGDLSRRIRRDLPIADTWDWLIREYPEVGAAQLVRAHGRLRSGLFGPVRLGSPPRSYVMRTHVITASPLEVHIRHE